MRVFQRSCTHIIFQSTPEGLDHPKTLVTKFTVILRNANLITVVQLYVITVNEHDNNA